MKKVFNQTNLLEGAKVLVPWKFIIIYKYNQAVVSEQASVAGFGITKDNEKASLFSSYTLDWQPEQETVNGWLTSAVLIVAPMNLVNVWIEIEGVEYIDLDRIDMIVRTQGGPAGTVASGTGPIDPGGGAT